MATTRMKVNGSQPYCLGLLHGVCGIVIEICYCNDPSFRTDRPGQTVQTKIRLLLEEQSDQRLHCLQFHLHLLEALVYGKAWFSNFRVITSNFSDV